MHTVLRQQTKKLTLLSNFADLSDTPDTHHRISIVANAVATAATFCIDSFNSYRGPHFFSSLGFVRNLLFPHRTVTPLHLRNMQQSMCILTYCILQTETSIYDVAARLRKLCGVWVCWTCGVYGEWRLEECLLVAKLARQFYSLYQLAFISRCISLHTISFSSIFFVFFCFFNFFYEFAFTCMKEDFYLICRQCLPKSLCKHFQVYV